MSIQQLNFFEKNCNLKDDILWTHLVGNMTVGVVGDFERQQNKVDYTLHYGERRKGRLQANLQYLSLVGFGLVLQLDSRHVCMYKILHLTRWF